MKGQKALFSKASDEWETPPKLFDRLDNEFHFALDAAATEQNKKAYYWYDKEHSALERDWLIPRNNFEVGGKYESKYHTVFVNPPYSQISKFIEKAYQESLKGVVVVCLIPCRSDTRYWHNYIMKAQEIRFIKGRLKFNNRTLPSYREDLSHKVSSATFPSVVVIFTRWHPHYWNQDVEYDLNPIIGETIK
jgi:site-specific DNA-methyltransferase (adenine-specific)